MIVVVGGGGNTVCGTTLHGFVLLHIQNAFEFGAEWRLMRRRGIIVGIERLKFTYL